MAIDTIGKKVWDEEISEDEKKKLIAAEIWIPSVYEKWLELKSDMFLSEKEILAKQQKILKKIKKLPPAEREAALARAGISTREKIE